MEVHDVTPSWKSPRITPSEIVQYNISIPQLLTNTQKETTLQGLPTQQSFLSILNSTYVNYRLNIYTIM